MYILKNNLIINVNIFIAFSFLVLYNILRFILNGQINKDESFENYLLNILYQKTR